MADASASRERADAPHQGPGSARGAALRFRAALDAMARPGSLRAIEGVEPPEGLSPAAAGLVATLADAETPLWLPERLRGGAAERWVAFHANARIVPRGEAHFALGTWEELMPLETWPAGTPAYPDRSVTCLVEVAALSGGPVLSLRGPGIERERAFAPALPEDAAGVLAANAARFPMGVDLFFTAGIWAAALPRSSRVERGAPVPGGR